MKQILTILLMLLSLLITCCKESRTQNAITRRIDGYLAEMGQIGFSGSVLVELNGEEVISKGFGFSNREKQIKNSVHTIYDIGSVTKQFTATAILKLEMEGKLSTDDKLTKYFNDVPNDKENITIHDLLRHQSGLKSIVGDDYEKISQEEYLRRVFSSPLKFESGTAFSYSNIGYSLLAMIIEKVSGQSYESYLYENLWKPAHMEMTGYSRPVFDTNLIAVGYSIDNRIWGKPTWKAWDSKAPYWNLKGNGGILSTTEDLFKWDKALKTSLILSEAAKHKLYHPKLRAGETENSIYAYGWDVSKTSRNTTRVWHNGTNRIFYADFMRFTDEDITLIMLSNKADQNYNNLNSDLAKMIFVKDYKPEIPAEDNEINRNFTSLIIKTLEDSGLDEAKTTYHMRGKNENLLEYVMRNEGFDHIDNGKPDIALRIFEMNVFAYPSSAKALQGLGEGYMETGDKVQARKYFRQCLKYDPENDFVKRMLIKLEEQ